jgi:hypothetical protein
MPDAILSLFDDAEQFVTSCLEADPETVDLAPMQGKIAAVCGAVAALPGAEGQQYRNRLEALMAQIDHLSVALKLTPGDVKQALSGATQQHQAHAAYRKRQDS